MSEKYLLKETAPFVQFSSVKPTDDFNPEFDIEKTPKQTLDEYCQQLINRSFSITHSQIPEFICHHCLLVKDPVQWLNKFEKLLSLTTIFLMAFATSTGIQNSWSALKRKETGSWTSKPKQQG
ncbi:hypothetical protein CO230_03890 [Chryseobacterium sp. 6424]|uniref:hypothetical protein n=1 Tax=Chryseobacterium sp. 6424 TaxID=2039166 RepID=UPI000EFB67D4|nr:hypothetical protein [Chryseobacterium sp. 6424]AYO57339.1 hypothetical protein CO230_03890 [Chryseobacterium sp. 6424]